MQTDSHLFSILGSKSKRNMHESAHQTIFCGTPCACVICKQCGFGGSLKVPSVSVQNEANLSSLNPPVVFGGGRYPLLSFCGHTSSDEGSGTQNITKLFPVSHPTPAMCSPPVPALGSSSATPSCNTFLSRTSMPRNAASFTIYLLKFSS